MTDDPTGVPRYPSTGWHETANGPAFVHAGGAIGHDGAQAGDVDLAAELASVALPAPTTDPDRLTAAYQRGGEPLRQLPARLTAPLSGLVFRSLLVPVDTTIVVWGPRGVGKSTLTRVHLQHIAPDTRCARGVLSVNHMTTKGLQRLLGQANDIPVVLDDFGVGLPSRTATQVREHLTRIVHSRMSFTYALAQAGQIGTTPPLRCSLIFTSETAAEGSAAARSVNLELGADAAEAVDGALDTADGAAGRSLIGASYIQWLAEHRATLLRRRAARGILGGLAGGTEPERADRSGRPARAGRRGLQHGGAAAAGVPDAPGSAE